MSYENVCECCVDVVCVLFCPCPVVFNCISFIPFLIFFFPFYAFFSYNMAPNLLCIIPFSYM